MSTVLLARTVVALALLTAGAAKIGRPTRTREMLREFGVPSRLAPLLGWLLPLAELGLGVALVPAATARWGAIGSLALFLVFLAAIGWNLALGRRPDCACFGAALAGPIGWKTVSRNLILVALAALIVLEPATGVGPGLLHWVEALTAGESIALGIGLLACAAAAFEGWLLANLLDQNGRLLRRLDALESGSPVSGSARAPGRTQPASEPPVGLPIGHEAPPFALSGPTGRTISLSELRARGRDVLLLFMDPGCGPCTALLPDVARWQREDGDALTVAVITRDGVEAEPARFTGHDLGIVLLEVDAEVSSRYQAHGTPAAVLVDASGQIASSLARGAEGIRRLVRSRGYPARGGRRGRLAIAAPATAGIGLLATVALLAGAAPGTRAEAATAPYVLAVEDGADWRTWWRADSAPEVWHEPVPAVLAATRWWAAAPGVDWGELVISGGSLALRTRVVLGRYDPLRYQTVLVGEPPLRGRGWSVEAADPRAVLAFNGGQFRDAQPWGWLVRQGREVQPPGSGPLSVAIAMMADGATRFLPFDSLGAVRKAGLVTDAFQSYPALLVKDGRVPHHFRHSGGLLDLGHRDTRLALCALADGRLLVALTRFENLGRVFGSLPIGLTLNEMAAVMGALGCRSAVSLDGGISAQLLVRPEQGPARRWEGWRGVPLGIEVRPRP
jgi:uncharacterized membrane protein YphA (DoxX/SURF4 family)/peroxiredoxin